MKRTERKYIFENKYLLFFFLNIFRFIPNFLLIKKKKKILMSNLVTG